MRIQYTKDTNTYDSLTHKYNLNYNKTMVKNKFDARYQRTERTLWRTFCTLIKTHPFTITISELCRKSNIHPVTFYRHAHDLDDFLAQQKAIIEQEYDSLLRTTTNQPLPIIFRRLLIFIHKRRSFFNYLIISNNSAFAYILIDKLKPDITRSWNNYGLKLNQNIYQLYCAEVIALLITWGKNRFPITHIPHLNRQLNNLTKTAPIRLASILKE